MKKIIILIYFISFISCSEESVDNIVDSTYTIYKIIILLLISLIVLGFIFTLLRGNVNTKTTKIPQTVVEEKYSYFQNISKKKYYIIMKSLWLLLLGIVFIMIGVLIGIKNKIFHPLFVFVAMLGFIVGGLWTSFIGLLEILGQIPLIHKLKKHRTRLNIIGGILFIIGIASSFIFKQQLNDYNLLYMIILSIFLFSGILITLFSLIISFLPDSKEDTNQKQNKGLMNYRKLQ